MADRGNHYEAAFEADLRTRQVAYVAVDEARLAQNIRSKKRFRRRHRNSSEQLVTARKMEKLAAGRSIGQRRAR